MIPKTINYIFGLEPGYCGKPFEYFHYLNILSASKINKDYKINLYYYYEPDSIYFKELYKFCNLIKLSYEDIKMEEFQHFEHIGDLLRLKIINKYGGIYLDVDNVCISSFDPLLNNEKEFIMGVEIAESKTVGLCNAVLLSTENSVFSNIWINDYKDNYKPDWNYNSVIRPLELSTFNQNHIHIEPSCSFFKYSWDENGFNSIFNENSDVTDCYSLHLWEHKNYSQLKKYNIDYIEKNNDTLSNLYKRYIL